MEMYTEVGVDHFNEAAGPGVRNKFARFAPELNRAFHAMAMRPHMAAAPGATEVSPLKVVSPEMSAEWLQTAERYAGARFSSFVGSRQGGGEYADWDTEGALLRSQDLAPLAPGGTYRELDDKVEFKSYACLTRGGARVVADQTVANDDIGIDSYARAIRFLNEAGLQDLERRIHKAVGSKGDWALSADGAASRSTGFGFGTADDDLPSWDRPATGAQASTPIDDVLAAGVAIAEKTGYSPNAMLMSPAVYVQLASHPTIVARINAGQTSGTAIVNRMVMASVFGLDRVEVSYARDASGNWLFGKNAILAYVPLTKGMNEPSAIMRVGWTGLRGDAGDGTSMKTIREESREADMVHLRTSWAIVQQSRNLGVFFNNIVA